MIKVLKIGGSILSPSQEKFFDVDFVRDLKDILNMFPKDKFILIAGGGSLARKYQFFAMENGVTDWNTHWIGLSANNLNAAMLKAFLGDGVEDTILAFEAIGDAKKINFVNNNRILVAGANLPGHSGDMDASILAYQSGSLEVISLKDVDGVYDTDPDKNTDAKKIKNLSWDEYKDIIKTDKFKPKGAFPVDPVTANYAEDKNVTFKILDGKNLNNLKSAIEGKEFEGSIIS